MNWPRFWQNVWYGGSRWQWPLRPLSMVFSALARRRRRRLQRTAVRVSAPVIIVGNISVGGTGKTPLIIALVRRLQQEGYYPGVISRGYGGRAPDYPLPLQVTAHTPVAHSGDEPLSIARATGCPVCVSPDRVAAAQQLCAKGCDVILSDDGLQHYRLDRQLEIAVVDGERAFGNEQCLPAGPLREPIARLQEVDWVVVNGPRARVAARLQGLGSVKGRFKSSATGNIGSLALCQMRVEPVGWQSVAEKGARPLEYFKPGTRVHAVAGIGHPERFFDTLRNLQLTPIPHPFPDHHPYRPEELAFGDGYPVVMTDKDAAKCSAFAQPHWWSLSVEAQLEPAFWSAFLARVETLTTPSERTISE